MLVLPDGNFFGEEHEMTLRIEGLEKPKRKRGRPKKEKKDLEQSEPDQQEMVEEAIQEDESEYDENGRKRRRRKVPQRFMEAVQGKELDRILREEGAIDENESDDLVLDEDPNIEVKDEVQIEAPEEIGGGE